ncbi:hypothetical protein [Vibrio galatheae]|nr:hypothetical protein [Vibrio galatheae]
MARTTKSLTDKQIFNAKPQDKEYTLFDGLSRLIQREDMPVP